MSDLIDRQTAVNAILSLTKFNSLRDLYERAQKQREKTLSGGWTGGINDAIDAVMALPSAQPEQRWVPVTKDSLPEEGKVVIVKGEKGTWDVGTYRGYSHIVGLEDIHRWIWKKNKSKKVYWWMYKDGALPEPYREEGGE